MRWILSAAFAALFSALPIATEATPASAKPLLRHFVAEADGTLTLEPDGTVSAATLPDTMEPALRDAYLAAIRRWTFEPVVIDGRAVRAIGHMRLTLGITLEGSALHSGRIESVTFTDPSGHDGRLGPEAVLHPPRYPMELARRGISGEVVLAVETDAEGRIVRAAAQSGRIYADVRPRDEARAQRDFGLLVRASVQAAANWHLPGCRSSVCTVPLRYTMLRNLDRPPFWWPSYAVPVTPEPWALGAGILALGADGAAPSPRFRPTTKVDGVAVLRAGG